VSPATNVIDVRDRGMAKREDEQVFGLAVAEERVIVSADIDFGTLQVLRKQRQPSVMLFGAVLALYSALTGRGDRMKDCEPRRVIDVRRL
jgi:hypothetical protein